MKQLTRYHAKAPIGKAVLVAALGQHNKYCERLGGATINVTAPPRRGSVSTAERVEFVIKNSGDGNCVGMKANGTGVFYTAAAAGRDAFEFDAVFKNYTTHWIVDTVNN